MVQSAKCADLAYSIGVFFDPRASSFVDFRAVYYRLLPRSIRLREPSQRRPVLEPLAQLSSEIVRASSTLSERDFDRISKRSCPAQCAHQREGVAPQAFEVNGK